MTFTSHEDRELNKGICQGLSVLWIKRYRDHPEESGLQRIAFLQDNIRRAATIQNYYHEAKGVAFSPAYQKKKEMTREQSESLQQVKKPRRSASVACEDYGTARTQKTE